MRRFLTCALFCASALTLAAAPEPVHTANGLLSGVPGRSPGVRVYKGVPYAAPPVGELRWKAPQPAAAWDGVRKADKFSPICEQAPYPKSSLYYQEPEPMSEDCLYLNIWTAASSPSDKQPVMVWIHGGALTRGSGSIPAYDGEALTKKGVIVVTINYRLGIFGFLAHPELTRESGHNSSGNYAFLDQIAALDWVQKNIAAFGGDPKRVTIFGESAGSWSVNYLMATPLAKGLFQRAIGESGGAFGPMKALAEVEEAGRKFAKSANADSLAALRAKPAADLLSIPAPGIEPNVDGWMLPTDVYSIFAEGKQNDVPLIAGSNADEAKTLAPWPSTGNAKMYTAQIKMRFGSDTDKVLKLYPAATEDQAKTSYYESFNDFVFAWQMRTWVRLQAGKPDGKRAYLYYFSHYPPGPDSDRYGAFHASEIPYVFDNLDLAWKRAYTDYDRKLADMISQYWVNFAATGNPNGEGLMLWPAYTNSNDAGLEFGDTTHLTQHLHKAGLDFFDQYFASKRHAPAPATAAQ